MVCGNPALSDALMALYQKQRCGGSSNITPLVLDGSPGGGMHFDISNMIYTVISIQMMRCTRSGLWTKVKQVVFTQAIWAIMVYRFQRWIMFECRILVVKHVLSVASAPVELLVQILTGINIQAGCEIGPGLYIGHYGSIFIHGDVKLGKFCNISHENTLGIAGRGDKRGVPEIGDFVYIAQERRLSARSKLVIMWR